MSYRDRIARVAVLIAVAASAAWAVALPDTPTLAIGNSRLAHVGGDELPGLGLFVPRSVGGGHARSPEVPAGGAVIRHVGDRVLGTEDEGVDVFATGSSAFEPTLGFTDSGALFFQGYGTYEEDPSGDGLLLNYPFVLRSSDLGATWENVSPRDDQSRRHQMSWDPYLYVDPLTSRVFTVDYQPGSCALVSYSDDDGESWTTNRTACGLTDYQKVFAGPPAYSTTTGYPNVVYYCSIGFGLGEVSGGSGCQKSLDGGKTFIPVSSPFINNPAMHESGFGDIPGLCGGGLSQGWVGADGTVYVPAGQCGHPWLAISDDEGLTWRHVRIDVGSDLGSAEGESGLLVHTPETPVTPEVGFPDGPYRSVHSHHGAFAGDSEGNLYYAWDARDRAIYLSVSHDGAATWSAPIRVSPPQVIEAALPSLVVGAPGRVAIGFVGSENAPGPRDCRALSGCPESVDERYKDVSWTGYISVTDQALATEPEFVTGAASLPDDPLERGYCSPTRCGAIGDFFDVAIGPDGHAWASFADHCDAEKCFGARVTTSLGIVMHMTSGPKLAGPLDITIDVKPGTDDNSINNKSAGSVPVAILSNDSFDALSVDPTSVAFGPSGAASTHDSAEDIDGDGDVDLVLHFDQQQTGLSTGDTQACLTGAQRDGDRVRGIRIRGCDAVSVK